MLFFISRTPWLFALLPLSFLERNYSIIYGRIPAFLRLYHRIYVPANVVKYIVCYPGGSKTTIIESLKPSAVGFGNRPLVISYIPPIHYVVNVSVIFSNLLTNIATQLLEWPKRTKKLKIYINIYLIEYLYYIGQNNCVTYTQRIHVYKLRPSSFFENGLF